MSVLLLALTIGCSSTPTAPAPPTSSGVYPTDDQPQGPATAAMPLHTRLDDARFELADSSLPEGFGTESTITVLLSDQGEQRRLRFPVPFLLDADARTRFGRDATVTVDGQAFAFAPLGGGVGTWRLHKGDIVLQTRAGARQAVIDYAGARQLLADRVLSASGRSPAEFVSRSLTIQGRTVPGIMLPSPSAATWTVEVPERAPRFRGELALMPGIVAGASSDGVGVAVEVVADGVATPIVEQTVGEVAFTEVEADLAMWAGQTVEIRLRSEVAGSPDHDYAFIGAPTIWGQPTEEVRRVLVIGLDTTRPASIGAYGYPRPTTPELDELAARSIVATNAWTPAPRTRPSFRSATTGRYPLLAVGATNIGEVFQQRGFATAGFVANIHLQPRFDFHEGFDVWSFDGRADADDQVDRALAWFGANVDRDSYMFLHFMDPHLAYDAPGEFRDMFVDDPDPKMPRGFSRWVVSRWMAAGSLTEQRKDHIRGLYDGEMRFMSQQIGRLVKALDGMPGKTTIVVHSDHGEEFFEHGGFEHNHTLYDEVTRAVLLVRPPGGTTGGSVQVAQNATLADIAPTLYGLVGFDDAPPSDGIDLIPFAKGAPTTDRPIPIGHLRYGLDLYGVVASGHKYIVETGSGREELYDLRADPGEQSDRSAMVDLAPWRSALIAAHPELVGGMGWRIDVVGKVPRFSMELPAGARAGVLDPSLQSPKRPNLAWGEAPGRGPDSVGVVDVSGDRLTFEPGGSAGQLWVLGDGTSAPPMPGTVVDVDGSRALEAAPDGARQARFTTGGTITLRPAMVIVPPPGEAARMKTLSGEVGDATSDETCRLCELGYIEGDSCAGC